jgi:hypothetical protein
VNAISESEWEDTAFLKFRDALSEVDDPGDGTRIYAIDAYVRVSEAEVLAARDNARDSDAVVDRSSEILMSRSNQRVLMVKDAMDPLLFEYVDAWTQFDTTRGATALIAIAKAAIATSDKTFIVTEEFLNAVFERLWQYSPEDQEDGLQREHLRTSLKYAISKSNHEKPL